MAILDYTTVARVKTYLEAGGADPVGGEGDSFDALLGRIISDVSARFERHLGRGSYQTRRTEYFDVDRGQQIFALYAFPNITISTITNDSAREWSTGDLSSDSYAVDDENGLIQVDRTWLAGGPQVLRVIYTGGLATGTTGLIADYPDLAHACDLQVMYQFRRRNDLAHTSVSMGGTSVGYVDPLDLLPAVREMLGQRARVRFG